MLKSKKVSSGKVISKGPHPSIPSNLKDHEEHPCRPQNDFHILAVYLDTEKI